MFIYKIIYPNTRDCNVISICHLTKGRCIFQAPPCSKSRSQGQGHFFPASFVVPWSWTLAPIPRLRHVVASCYGCLWASTRPVIANIVEHYTNTRRHDLETYKTSLQSTYLDQKYGCLVFVWDLQVKYRYKYMTSNRNLTTN